MWGEITISLSPKDQGTKIAIDCMANVDNAFALFKSPGKTILGKFKNYRSYSKTNNIKRFSKRNWY